jgi:Amt family ammonium transporter
MTFAIITPALITGGLAERMKFSSLLVFMAAWSLIVYSPVAHWVWGPDGYLRDAGILDFAGGTVVHISSGFSALVAAIVLGKRHGHGNARFEPHNISISLIGASLLWVGWFGFNGGSAVASGAYAGLALSTTQIATGAAGMSWMMTEWALKGKPTVMGVISGAVSGLVCITPACGFVDHNGAIIMGFICGIVCSFSVRLKHKLGYDDALDAFGVHGVGGVLGALLTGLFASPKLNNFYPGCPIKDEPCGGPFTQRVSGAFYDHLLPKLYGHEGATNRHGLQLGLQFYGIVVVAGWASFCTFVLLKIIDKIMGLRVDIKDEVEGLDASVHGETVYYGETDDMKPVEGQPKLEGEPTLESAPL